MCELLCSLRGYRTLYNNIRRAAHDCRDALAIAISRENRPGLLRDAASSGNVLRLRLLLRACPWSDEEVAHALFAVPSRRSARAVARAIARARPAVFQAASPWAVVGAVMAEDMGALRGLLDAGAAPDRPCGPSGESPLHVAAACRRRDCAFELILRGADPNPCDENGETPLHRAATGTGGRGGVDVAAGELLLFCISLCLVSRAATHGRGGLSGDVTGEEGLVWLAGTLLILYFSLCLVPDAARHGEEGWCGLLENFANSSGAERKRARRVVWLLGTLLILYFSLSRLQSGDGTGDGGAATHGERWWCWLSGGLRGGRYVDARCRRMQTPLTAPPPTRMRTARRRWLGVGAAVLARDCEGAHAAAPCRRRHPRLQHSCARCCSGAPTSTPGLQK
ncbi:Ankyrin repeat family A protein 2, partial [Gryllus bimaculatus]